MKPQFVLWIRKNFQPLLSQVHLCLWGWNEVTSLCQVFPVVAGLSEHTRLFPFFSIAAHPAQRAHLQASTSENLQLESARDYRPSVPLVRQPLCGRSQDMSRVWWHWSSHFRLYECKINWNVPKRILDCQQLLHSCFIKFISVCIGSWCLINPISFSWRKVGGYGFKLLLKKKKIKSWKKKKQCYRKWPQALLMLKRLARVLLWLQFYSEMREKEKK